MSLKKINLAFFAALLIVLGTSAFAAEFSAEVLSVSGKVERLENDKWVPIAVGDMISKGTVIQTGFKSKMSIAVKESIVNVSPLTRMTVEQLAETEEKDNTSLFVSTGKVTSDVRRRDNRKVGFVVRSPVATASVRGTIVSVRNCFRRTEVKNDRGVVATWSTSGISEASILEGDADVTETVEAELKNEQNVVLHENQGVNVSDNGNLGSIRENTVQDSNNFTLPKSAAVSEAISSVASSGIAVSDVNSGSFESNTVYYSDNNSSTSSNSNTNTNTPGGSSIIPTPTNPEVAPGSVNINITFPGH
ncbi:MAG: FecR domain-containing protein [Treponema sp.]|nr:FecR domain-containing protein [Treponema sp.]